ncbi:unnamed protein product [Didymodactylos carnosus]|uniref:Transposase Helix-turn-helix domain-containing protein n=1 Tax=Didymodactylos carnosus TaxID=1234261 RepID=A0A815C2B6_9BILA|nr:unnamed protein product [Didymodactylos carnosus]CAF1278109.1 unnamed protein product [Didymodactylos carnosus]CAF3711086.1 unnamed protein product [Didymodactylos carnosus]CAF4071383.1 unnamed protein product [Didymodactylos carnosus]
MCCVCRASIGGEAMTVSSEDCYLLLLKKNVFIPEGARCCSDHVTNRRFKSEAMDKIAPYSIQMKKLNAVDVQLLLSKWQMLYKNKKRFDFDNSQSMSDDEYRALTSLSKSQFDDRIRRLSQSKMRNSSNRSIRTAIAILVCKLRLGLSNQILAILFELPDKKTVSRILESARSALMAEFVLYNLGFSHISRREIIDQHTTNIAKQLMCGNDNDTAVVVIDSTYVYIQVKNN